MGNLGPRRVKDIFRNWLQADTGNQGINGTLVRVQDGAGNNTPIRLSTDVVAFDGDVTIDGTLTATTHTVTSITGNAGTATALQAGGADRIKLDGIATGATANSSDATLLNRTNHTGTQAISTVSGLQTALDAKAPLASPTFTGVPAAPTATAGTNTTQVATTAFVKTAVDNLVASAPAALDTLDELAAALGDDANFAATLTTSLAAKAPLASPAFTGTPTAPTASAGTNTTQIATTAFVTTADNLKANLASPTFTGTPAAPTASAGTSTTQLATTAFVTTADNLKANLASPTFTGTPAAPTATAGTNTTQIATTAFVTAGLALKADAASPTFTGTAAFATLTTSGSATIGTTLTVSGNNRLLMGADPGSIGASTLNPPRMTIAGTSGAANCNLALSNTSSSAGVAGEIWHAKSLAAGGTPTTTNNSLLGASRYYGHDSSVYGEAAVISAAADGASAAGSTPGRLVFSTTASGAVASTERMRITADGYLQVGGTSSSTVARVLVVHDSSAVATGLLVRDSNTSAAADTGTMVEFNFHDGSSNRSTGYIKNLKENSTSGNTASYMTFGTRAAGSGGVSERLRIDSTGVISVASNYVLNTSANEWAYRQQQTSATIGVRNHVLTQRSLTAGAVTAGTNLGGIAMGGHTGTAYTSGWNGGAEISAFAEETWTTSTAQTRLAFFTNPTGSVTPLERMRITGSGQVSLGGPYDAEAFRANFLASAVNRVEAQGATTGNTPVIRSNGSNTNIALTVGTTGTGQISFATNGAATEQARIAHVASAVNYAIIQGGATGTPVIVQTGGSDTNRDIKISAAGTGVVDLGTTSATSATAGAQTLPANPAGFLNLKLNGTAIKVPYYNA